MRAFLTGSRAYGTPGEDSDIDLVIRCGKKTLELLKELSEHTKPSDSDIGPDKNDEHSVPVKFGKLNLLCCLTDISYEVWAEGTRNLKEKAPVKRGEAIAHFTKLRLKAGLLRKE